jgi:hypothetical protein
MEAFSCGKMYHFFSMGANRMAAADWEVRVSRAGLASAELDRQGDSLRVSIKALRVRRPETVELWARGAGPLLPGTRHTLSFLSGASSARLIGVTIREPGGPPEVQASVPITRQLERHVLALVIPKGKVLKVFELSFELGRDEGEVELSDVEFQDGPPNAP